MVSPERKGSKPMRGRRWLAGSVAKPNPNRFTQLIEHRIEFRPFLTQCAIQCRTKKWLLGQALASGLVLLCSCEKSTPPGPDASQPASVSPKPATGASAPTPFVSKSG